MKNARCVQCREFYQTETGVVFHEGQYYNLYYNWRKGHILEGLIVDIFGADNEWFLQHFKLV